MTAERRQLSLTAAFEAVIDVHNADVLAFDRLASRLPSFGPDIDPFVPGWVQAVRHNVYGFATAASWRSSPKMPGPGRASYPRFRELAPAQSPSWTIHAGRSDPERRADELKFINYSQLLNFMHSAGT